MERTPADAARLDALAPRPAPLMRETLDGEKMVRTNPIRELIRAELRILLESYEAASQTSHSATVGALREAYLRALLAKFIPSRFAITSGFITDPLGTVTPQLDFIAYDPAGLPRIALQPDLSVVPVDSVLLIAEIKSTLSTSVFDQVCRQREAINKMVHSCIPVEDTHLKIPHVILAFNNEVALNTLASWFEQCSDLMSICVVRQFFVDRIAQAELQHLDTSEGDFEEMLTFLFRLFNGLYHIADMRAELRPRFEEYLFPEG